MNFPSKSAIVYAVVFLGFIAFLLWGQGCDVEKMVKVTVEPDMQEALDIPAQVTYYESVYTTEEWKHFIRMNTWRWEDNVADAAWTVATIKSLINIGMQEGPGLLSAVPAGASIAALLAFMWGRHQDRPGAKDRERDERERGRQEGIIEANGTNTGTPS